MSSLALLVGLCLIALSMGAVPRLGGSDHLLQNYAAIGTGLTFIAAIVVFFSPAEGHAVGYLLLEHGELSLGRTQVFIWLVSAISIYGGMVLPHLQLAAFPTALAPILGGSLATAVLGVATAPSQQSVAIVNGTASQPQAQAQPQPQAQTDSGTSANTFAETVVDSVAQQITLSDQQKSDLYDAVVKDFSGLNLVPPAAQAAVASQGTAQPAPATPIYSLSSLVEDFRGQGDITRYQFLFLTVLGSFLLLVGFLVRGTVPDSIPQDLLYLMGGSALGYLGTKTVKSISIENEASRTK